MSYLTIYLTSVAQAFTRAPGFAGRNNVWSIAARPRTAREHGHGRCWPLAPCHVGGATDERAALNVQRVQGQAAFEDARSDLAREKDVEEIRLAGQIQRGESISFQVHRAQYFDGPARRIDGETLAPCRHLHPDLAPGRLFSQTAAGGLYEVKPGDTLICACSVERARAGDCHRAWAAVLLAGHGWTVVLDGQRLELASPPEYLRGLWPRANPAARAA